MLRALGLAWLVLQPLAASQEVDEVLVVEGLTQPVHLTGAPGEPGRLFVCEQAGRVRVVDGGVLLVAPFLDVSGSISLGGERGLLALAFHPDYASNGRLFVSVTGPLGESRVDEYRVSADPNVAEPARVATLLEVAQPFSNNNGGCIAFGPDDMLYVGLGDGGGGNDPDGRAQDGADLLGKLLRLDVDLPAPHVPADNPFVGDPGVRDEIWALGVRNPWRFAFDPLQGDLFVGDVGQSTREEISVIPAGQGGANLGWRCMEGTHCTNLSGCVCNAPALTMPIHEYDHSGGACSVVGGVVHRFGGELTLNGTYFFADFCTSDIWSLRYENGQVTDFTDRTQELSGDLQLITSFGQDEEGRVYVVEADGQIWRIDLDCSANVNNTYCVGSPNSLFPAGAAIGAFGSRFQSDNNYTLAVGGAVTGEFGYFIFGGETQQLPISEGFLCVAPGGIGLQRLFPAQQIGFLGSTNRQLDFGAAPEAFIETGRTTYFQFWYRDPGSGAGHFNFSNGLAVVFCP